MGIYCQSRVGIPGTPDAKRVPINGGVWRYHPTRKIFELWAEGVSNQWGLDWNDRGEAFFAACVISHMWHGIEGARYDRQNGKHFNPHIYENIQTIAWGKYEKAAYCGAMIYLGGEFPDEYRDRIFFHDIHMNAMRSERLVKDGSGYRSERAGDFLASPDAWFRGLSPQYGPDGSVFLNDWYDKVPCHQQRTFTDRSNGRIYRITSDAVKPVKADLTTATDADLVAMQLHKNDWFVRHARLLLQERGAKPETTAALEKILFENPDETRQLRALWALHGQNALSAASALRAMEAKSDHVRGWVVTCVSEDGKPAENLIGKITKLASNDPSPVVRLRIASAAQRIPAGDRWPLLEALAGHAEDATDRNLPLMIWYATEGAVAADPARGITFLQAAKIPKLHEFVARRVTAMAIENGATAAPAMEALVKSLGVSNPNCPHLLRGILTALTGRATFPEPEGWAEIYELLQKDAGVSADARKLAIIFGSKAALTELRAVLLDASAAVDARRAAIGSLKVQRDAASLDPLLALVAEAGPLRPDALRALAVFEDDRIAPAILGRFSSMEKKEQEDSLNTLTARPQNTRALLAAIDEKLLSARIITAPLARIIQGYKEPAFDSWLEKNYGSLKTSSADKQKEIENYKKFLSHDAISRANPKHGREIFEARCAVCHTIFGKGGKIGPELPGSYADVDYLLQNILDPNAVVGIDYQQVFITIKSGELHAGSLIGEDANSYTLKTLAAPVTIPRGEVKTLETSVNSMMPEGLMNGLEEPEIRDLFLYLRQSKAPKE